MKEVILVAGHAVGGDPGATGQGTTEAVEAQQIVDRLYDILLPMDGIGVEKVPHNLDYIDSTAWINSRYKWDPDTVVLEVHLNAPAVASGAEILVPGGDPDTLAFGQRLQRALIESTGLPNRGVKVRQDLYLIVNANPLAALAEVRFIGVDDNSDNADQKAAIGLANGLCDYFGLPRPGATVNAPVSSPEPVQEPVATKTVNYRVYVNGKQVGAYTQAQNAYNKYTQLSGAIIKDSSGNDVTSKVVEQFDKDEETPVVVAPTPEKETPPVVTEIKTVIVNAIVTFIQAGGAAWAVAGYSLDRVVIAGVIGAAASVVWNTILKPFAISKGWLKQ